jgi:hypothetical protein
MIKSRNMRWMSTVVHMEEMKNVYKFLFRKSEGERSLGRS